jgi:hypothetical protein
MVIAVSAHIAVGFAPVEARSKVMKGILAALAALIEALIAAESSARAMTMSTPLLIRSSMFAAWRAGSPFATLKIHLIVTLAASPVKCDATMESA